MLNAASMAMSRPDAAGVKARPPPTTLPPRICATSPIRPTSRAPARSPRGPLVRILHGVVDAFREAETFVFHTRLAHESASLRDRDVTRAVDRLSLMAQGIGGGTRI